MIDVTSESEYALANSDWNYDFQSLPVWDVRDKNPYVYDLLFENTKMDLAFLIYSILEYRMLAYAGFLAILRNKDKPELLFRTAKPVFGNTAVIFSRDGKLAFVRSSMWNGGWPIFVFDLYTQRFACVRTVIKNPCFIVKEFEQNEFVIVADGWQVEHDDNDSGLKELDGTTIETDTLQWLPLSDFDSFCERFEESSRAEQSPQGLGLFQRIRQLLFG